MFKAVVILSFILGLATLCLCQLNFSPGWGKRSQEECKLNTEAVFYIYKTIQNEIKKLVECEKLTR
ncbi:unnamed protein product [Nezara viridula]|uniref:Neuropeptide n=1 Tax=Nezara viridula TaxID=85310 RepID=A0A3S8RK49_NEZVI|nr:neuropeptide precursor [Nezara viridula]CAH1392893.1 unnamed protein product [Nezara viridula]